MSTDPLVESIYKASKRAFSDLFEAGESFYYCVLITTEEGHAPFVSAWSRESLRRESEAHSDDVEYASSVKWSYADSPYVDFASETFNEVNQLFLARPGIEELGPKEWLQELNIRIRAMERAIQMVDADGLFGQNQPRESILVNVEVVPPNYSNTDRAIRLNEAGNISLGEWLKEAAEQQ